MFRRKEHGDSGAFGGMVALGAVLCLMAGGGLIAAGTWLVEKPINNPVPLDQLGLTPEIGANLKQFTQSLPGTSIVGESPDEENQKKRVMLDPILFKANGNAWPFHGPQQTGDCSGFASAGVAEYDIAFQVSEGTSDEFHPIDRPAAYAQGRFENGRQIIKGQGSDPSLQASSFMSDGVLLADDPKLLEFLKQPTGSIAAYSGKRSTDWGNKYIPEALRDSMAKYKVRDVQACRTAQGVCNQITDAKRACFFGSFELGVGKIKLLPSGHNLGLDTTSWAHAQMITGYDGELWAQGKGDRLFYIVNSWGDNGMLPRSKIPGDRPGGYYLTWDVVDRICKQEQMVFALSGVEGFERREFPPDFHIFGAAGPNEGEQAVNQAEIAQALQPPEPFAPLPEVSHWPVTGMGVALLLLGVVLLWRQRGNLFRRPAAPLIAAVTLLATVTSATAQDVARPLSAGGRLTATLFSELPSGDNSVDFGRILKDVAAQQSDPFPAAAIQATAATRADYHEDLFTLIRQHVEDQQHSDQRFDKLLAAGDAAPTPYSEVVRVLQLLPKPEVGFVDLGCGADARWCIAAAERWKCQVTGIEIDHERVVSARRRVADLGLSDRITIIEGDALTAEFEADVGVVYLYADVLEQLRPRLEKLRAFASYLHRPPGLPVTKHGDSWIYLRPVQQQSAVWDGQAYQHPVCNNPGCAMCQSIRNQLATAPQPSQPASPQPKDVIAYTPQAAPRGHYKTETVRRCEYGPFGRVKRCWTERVQVWVPEKSQ